MKARRKLLLLALAGGVASAAITVPVVSAVAEDPERAPKAECELTKLAIPDGYKHAWARSVSTSGEYAAGGVPGEGGEVPVLWHDGEATVPPELKSDTTGAAGVNDSGQMVGSHYSGDATVPWLYQDGEVSDLNVPGGYSGFARDINDNGQIVGYLAKDSGDSPDSPALWTSASAEPILLDTAVQGTGGTAYSISEDGTITGKLINPHDETVHLWKWNLEGDGEELTRPDPGDLIDQDVKTSISGDQVVSVNSGNGPGPYPAYVWDLSKGTEGTEVDLPIVQAVSASGTIVGSSKDKKPAMLVDGDVIELPGAEGPGGNPDENTAHDINAQGDVVVGNIVDGETKHPALWTCG